MSTRGPGEMDRIEFIRDTTVGSADARVRILINGVGLEALARKVELPFAVRDGTPKLAGKYVGLRLTDLAPPSRILFGDAGGGPFSYGSETQVLGCDCEEPGCWPLVCRILARETTVEWSDFRQPHRSGGKSTAAWSHAGLGPFRFDRRLYEVAINDLADWGSG